MNKTIAARVLFTFSALAEATAIGQKLVPLDAPIEVFASTSDSALFEICRTQDRPCGLEEKRCNDLQNAPHHKMRLKKTTARKALDQVVQKHPGYRWTVSDGVLTLEPKQRTGPDLLSRKLDKVTIRGLTSKAAYLEVFKQAGLKIGGMSGPGSGRILHYASIDLELNDVTVREAMNSIAKADGKVLWKFCSNNPEIGDIGFYIDSWRESAVRVKNRT